MKPEIRERRMFMIDEFNRTGSTKKAIEATSRRFNVKKDILYADMNRRDKWLAELTDSEHRKMILLQLLDEAHKTLSEIEEFIKKTENDNCRLGALKLKTNVIFKLISFYNTSEIDELRQRVEDIEEIAKSRGWA